MARTSPTFRRRQLARRIRKLREQAGFTQHRAAADLDMSTSALSRKEIGDSATSVHEVRSMMDLYDAYDPDLLDLARASRAPGWWRAYGIEDRGFVDLETEACAIRELQVGYVPGLLQTEAYMRALFQVDDLSASKRLIDDATSVRLLRQTRLTDIEHPITLHVVIVESVLRRPVGGVQIMRAQLRQMVEWAELPNVKLQFLPSEIGATPGLEGSFTLLSYTDPAQDDILYIEHVAGAWQSEKSQDVKSAAEVFARLRSMAVDCSESMDRIARIEAEL